MIGTERIWERTGGERWRGGDTTDRTGMAEWLAGGGGEWMLSCRRGTAARRKSFFVGLQVKHYRTCTYETRSFFGARLLMVDTGCNIVFRLGDRLVITVGKL